MDIRGNISAIAARMARAEDGGVSKTEAEAMRSQIRQLQRDLDSAESANGFLQGKISALETKTARLGAENVWLRSQVADLIRRADVLVTHSQDWRLRG